MKNQLKKTIPLFFFAFLLVGSYTYVCHREYRSTASIPTQIKQEIEENSYPLPDIQVLKQIFGLIQKLIP